MKKIQEWSKFATIRASYYRHVTPSMHLFSHSYLDGNDFTDNSFNALKFTQYLIRYLFVYSRLFAAVKRWLPGHKC